VYIPPEDGPYGAETCSGVENKNLENIVAIDGTPQISHKNRRNPKKLKKKTKQNKLCVDSFDSLTLVNSVYLLSNLWLLGIICGQ
jgi:hypothetical protein